MQVTTQHRHILCRPQCIFMLFWIFALQRFNFSLLECKNCKSKIEIMEFNIVHQLNLSREHRNWWKECLMQSSPSNFFWRSLVTSIDFSYGMRQMNINIHADEEIDYDKVWSILIGLTLCVIIAIGGQCIVWSLSGLPFWRCNANVQQQQQHRAKSLSRGLTPLFERNFLFNSLLVFRIFFLAMRFLPSFRIFQLNPCATLVCML